jgi:hypothetical protein
MAIHRSRTGSLFFEQATSWTCQKTPNEGYRKNLQCIDITYECLREASSDGIVHNGTCLALIEQEERALATSLAGNRDKGRV